MKPFSTAALLLAFALFAKPYGIKAQSMEQLWNQLNTQKQMTIDVGNLEIHPKKQLQKFSNGVVIIGQESILKAESIVMDFKTESIKATGQAALFAKDQFLTADWIEFDNRSKIITTSNASVEFNVGDRKKKIAEKIMGFRWEELEFKQKKAASLRRIQLEKLKIQLEKSRHYARTSAFPKEVVWKYQRLLEKEDLIHAYKNPFAQRLGAKKRKSLRKRSIITEKAGWEQKPSNLTNLSYFKLRGDKITSVNSDNYTIENGEFTPCNCDNEKTPPWALSASKIKAKKEGYISLQNVFFKVKGIPVLYLPFFKFPIKSERQSGFLFPSFNWSRSTGTIVDLPLYLAPSKQFDVTLTPKYFENRGIQMNTDLRYATSKRTGWELNVGFLKDKTWSQEIRDRNLAKDLFMDGLKAARMDPSNGSSSGDGGTSSIAKNAAAVAAPGYWSNIGRSECVSGSDKEKDNCIKELEFRLSDNPSVWRTSVDWKGNHFFKNGVLFKTKGVWRSDRRLDEDTYSNRNYAASLVERATTRTYQDIQNSFSLSKENFYGQFSSNIGDYVNTTKQNSGFQIPVEILLDSGWTELISTKNWSFRTNLSSKTQLLKGLDLATFDQTDVLDRHKSNWASSVALKNRIPLKNRWGLNMDLRFGADLRYIRHENLREQSSGDKDSHIFSPFYGINLEVPLVKNISSSDSSGLTPFQMLHFLNLKVGFRSRPRLWREGPYVMSKDFLAEDGSGLSYSLADRGVIREQADDPIQDFDILRRQSRLYFGLGQILKIKKYRYEPKPSVASGSLGQKARAASNVAVAPQNIRQQALADLYNVNDNLLKKVTNLQTIRTPAGEFEAVTTDERSFIELDIGTEFDFYESKQRSQGENLWLETPVQSPWKDLEVRFKLDAGILHAKSSLKYDFFADRVRQHRHSIGFYLPKATSIVGSYQFYRNRSIALNRQSSIPSDIQLWSLKLKTDIIERFQLSAQYSKRFVDQKATTSGLSQPNLDEAYEAQYSAAYFPPSNCWGLRAIRTKPFDREEKNADYHLEFILKFGQYSRGLPDISDALDSLVPGGINEI